MLNFLQDDSGATAIEYGLIAALIAIAIIGGAVALGNGITELFSGTNSDISAAIN